MKVSDLSNETQEFLDSGQYLTDFCHEHADGCSDAIYYYKAHRLIAEAGRSERLRAEDDVEDAGLGSSDYDTLATRIAYFIIRNRTMDLIVRELEAYEEDGEDLTDEVREVIKGALA